MTAVESVAREKLCELRVVLTQNVPLLIAYSGGVDSTFLLAEATATLGNRVLGIIADSPSLPRSSLSSALSIARSFGASVEIIATAELSDPRYASNPINRCYFCKLELFSRMQQVAVERGFAALAYGENADDAFQVRPGSAAAREFRVLAPLRIAGLTKAEIRFLSRQKGLPTADSPAQPCLSSRIPHGTVVTRDALAMIERAEDYVRSHGFKIFRVRYLARSGDGPVAKLQVDPNEMEKLPSREKPIRQALLAIGFRNLIIDPDGYRAPAPRGSFNICFDPTASLSY
ncbi:MAG: ATP-dependent sacrificial sulfur transferase LarE [Verrucomicrobia bacterium]|nr:ATP-dependent sacrificial sulfur transferase LarE [Verrucomicrobiota bacterium]